MIGKGPSLRTSNFDEGRDVVMWRRSSHTFWPTTVYQSPALRLDCLDCPRLSTTCVEFIWIASMEESPGLLSSPVFLLPGLPNDVALLCISRVPCQYWAHFSLVCRSWRVLFFGADLLRLRMVEKYTEKFLLCLCAPVHEFPELTVCDLDGSCAQPVLINFQKPSPLRPPENSSKWLCETVQDEVVLVSETGQIWRFDFPGTKWLWDSACVDNPGERPFVCSDANRLVFITEEVFFSKPLTPSQAPWEEIAGLQTAHNFVVHGCVLLRNNLYVLSWLRPYHGRMHGRVDVYSFSRREWTPSVVVDAPGIHQRCQGPVAVVHGHIYCLFSAHSPFFSFGEFVLCRLVMDDAGNGSWDVVSEVPRPPAADGRVAIFVKCCFTAPSSARIDILLEGGMVRREGFSESSDFPCRWHYVVNLMGMGIELKEAPMLITVCKHKQPCHRCTLIGVGTINL